MYDGYSNEDLAGLLGVPRVVALEETTSTMDDAHRLAADGAPSGTLVVAERQTQGRGRSGAKWVGTEGSSILCTMIERAPSAGAIDVLSLRVGVLLAAALDQFSDAPVQLKWPNDLIVNDRKLAGILIEARWRHTTVEWVAVAAGINIVAPIGFATAHGLRPGTRRLGVLQVVAPALRAAASRVGPLDESESAGWRDRDWLLGKRVTAPAAGVVRGILPNGALRVDTVEGEVAVRSGSVLLENP